MGKYFFYINNEFIHDKSSASILFFEYEKHEKLNLKLIKGRKDQESNLE